MNSLFFCQNDSLMRESHWQKDSLVTYILFDICLFKHFSMSQIFVISLYFLKIILMLFLQTFWTICTVVYTVACIIVRRLLISLHKWQFPGMAGWHPRILVPTWCPPSTFTNFSWAKSHNFFVMQKSKFTEI